MPFLVGLSSIPKRRTITPSHRLVRQQNFQGSFGLFLVHLTSKIRRLSPKSSDFSQLKTRNITRTYLIQNQK